MRVRLVDVAERAGVHTATASRALNEATRSRISSDTVRRVLKAAADLGYQPNSAAKSLATNRSLSIGVVIGDLTVPLFPPLLLGVDDVTSAAGYTALIVNTNNDRERERARISSIKSRGVDGLIVATATVGDGSDNRFYSSVAPTVFVVRSPANRGQPEVLSDDSLGVHAAVKHLIDLGHQRIAHVGGPANISTSVTRLRAYREALFENGLEIDPRLHIAVDKLTPNAGAEAFHHLVSSGADFTAAVAFNDSVAFGCYRAMKDLGLRCPDDISIVGYNDMTGADLVAPPLTTVAVDHYAMGAAAARMLLSMLGEPDVAANHSLRLPVDLVIRESTAPPRQR